MGPKAILLTALSSLLTSALANTNKDDVNGIFNSVSDDQWKTGLINVDEYRDDMFYWVFKARQNPEQAPLVLWLTGGPGCSSEIALLYENGPYRFNSRGKLERNTYSWNNYVNLLYVDQPIGTGYSKGGEHEDQTEL